MRAFMLATIAIAIAATGCGKTLRPGYCRTSNDCNGGFCDTSDGGGGTFTCLEAGTRDAGDGPEGGETGDASDDGDAVTDTAIDVPFRCTSSTQCNDHEGGAGNVCEIASGDCVECVMDSDCTVANRPFCDKTAHMCVRCTTDAQCVAKVPNPGVCMFHQDGRCAADSETIYVKNSTGCSMVAGVGGNLSVPYCFPQLAIDAVTATNRVVVMRGPDPLRFWNFAASGGQVTVIGQNGATISPGADVGIRINAGSVHVRDLKIAGGSSTGVVAASGSEVQMLGCVIQNNSAGGILIDGAAFDIENTTVIGNGPGMFGIATWGGILANTSPTTIPKRLNRVTVQNNTGTGLSCSEGIDGNGVFASGNTPVEITSTCGFSSCTTLSVMCGSRL